MDFLASIAVLVAATAVPAAPTPGAPTSHAEEIQLYASTMALAQVASDRCPDILINQPLLGQLHTYAHIMDAIDASTINEQGHTMIGVYTKAIAEAPTPQSWCDAVYRLYGPDGTVLQHLMLRDTPSPRAP